MREENLQKDIKQLEASEDTVSRQEVIDALDVLCQEHRYRIPGKPETYSEYNEAWQDALSRAESVVGNLPSISQKSAKVSVYDDCVSREDIINILILLTANHKNGVDEAIAVIKDLPSVKPKADVPDRNVGKWEDGILPNDYGGLPVIICDQCNTFYSLAFGASHNFCPNCGAKMEGAEE